MNENSNTGNVVVAGDMCLSVEHIGLLQTNNKKYGVIGGLVPVDVECLETYDIFNPIFTSVSVTECKEAVQDIVDLVSASLKSYFTQRCKSTLEAALAVIKASIIETYDMRVMTRIATIGRDDEVDMVALTFTNTSRHYADISLKYTHRIRLSADHDMLLLDAVCGSVCAIVNWGVMRQNVAIINRFLETVRLAVNPDAARLIVKAANKTGLLLYATDMLVYGIAPPHAVAVAEFIATHIEGKSKGYMSVVKRMFKNNVVLAYTYNPVLKLVGVRHKRSLGGLVLCELSKLPRVAIIKNKGTVAKDKIAAGLSVGDVDITSIEVGRQYVEEVDGACVVYAAKASASGAVGVERQYCLALPKKATKVDKTECVSDVAQETALKEEE